MTDVVVYRLVNAPVPSNCYIVYQEGSSNCLVIDPSNENNAVISDLLKARALVPVYILLTHEHFDHIRSVEYLRKMFSCKVVASDVASKHITDPRKNFSFYYNGLGFACDAADIIIEPGTDVLSWNDLSVKFYLTPGHSHGCMCFQIEEHIFTGDTIIQGQSTVVKLPGGNKALLKNSLETMWSLIDDYMVIHPGHGDSFKKPEMISLQ